MPNQWTVAVTRQIPEIGLTLLLTKSRKYDNGMMSSRPRQRNWIVCWKGATAP